MKKKEEASSLPTIALTLEVAGCKHACSFCWADGHYYPCMQVADVERILAETAEFCSSERLRFEPYPMHEVVAHPNALRIIELCKHYCANLFHPLPTSGVTLAAREDIDEFLEGIKALGISVLWFTLHGLGDVHNRVVHAPGAFTVTTQAVALGREAGFKCGANILVTKEDVAQVPDIIAFAEDIGLDEIGFEVSHYKPIPRLRKYESIRPELADLATRAEMLREHSRFWKDKWGNLPLHTEAHYTRAALDPEQRAGLRWSYFDENVIELVCRSNLDLHAGLAGAYGPCFGTMAEGAVRQTLQNAVEARAYCQERVYFPDRQIQDITDLARNWGDPEGQRIYFHPDSMRLRWIDLASGQARR